MLVEVGGPELEPVVEVEAVVVVAVLVKEMVEHAEADVVTVEQLELLVVVDLVQARLLFEAEQWLWVHS